MAKTYQENLNLIAYRVIKTKPDMPKGDLGIGYTEVLAPLPLILPLQPTVQTPVVRRHDELIQESRDDYARGKAVDITNFPQFFYIGEVI